VRAEGGAQRVRHCPACGATLEDPRSFAQEFWTAAERHVLCWCAACETTCTVVLAPRLVGTEPEH
jgi:hypothetical protein